MTNKTINQKNLNKRVMTLKKFTQNKKVNEIPTYVKELKMNMAMERFLGSYYPKYNT